MLEIAYESDKTTKPMFNEFANECKKTAFFWWGVTMFFLVTFNSFWVFNLILQSVVIYRLYIPILFVAMTLSMIIPIYPIMQSLRSYAKEVSKKQAIFSVIVLLVVIYADAVYFLLDPSIIFGKLFSGVVPEKILEYATNVQVLAQFIGIPLLYTIIVISIKKELVKKNFKINDEFKNNRRFAGEIVLINSVMCVVTLLIVK